MFIMWAVIIGLVIFGYFSFRGTQNRSLESTMELGLVISGIAVSIYYGLNPLFQIAAIILAIMLLLRKGFA